MRLFLAVPLGMLAAACATSKSVLVMTPIEYEGPITVSGKSLIQQMRDYKTLAVPSKVFAVGNCEDKTGKYLDLENPRYSRAVTQAGPDIIANYLFQAGFTVVERDPQNLGLIAQEYQMGHQFAPTSPPQPGEEPAPPQNVGLIQRGGPNGGLTGANYLVACAITTYNTSVENGGGGIDVDAIGVTSKYTVAKVGVALRIVDMSTGELISSMFLQTEVQGTTTSFHITRIFGDVTNTLATLTGGTTSTTITRPEDNRNIATLEFGGAANLPIDYAVIDALVANLARQLEANRQLFYFKHEDVKFDYEMPLFTND